jgi:hypothetical protein
MRKPFAALFLFLLPLVAVAGPGQARLDVPGYTGATTDTEVLQYDNGTFHWLTWGGMYRGTWFDTNDFVPDNNGFYLEMMEWWFFQHVSYPWDTNAFYAEIWTGDVNGPLILLDQQLVTAIHATPVYTYYDPPLWIEDYFWAVVNTEMSSGGWPSILGDYSMPGDAGHSFFTDDFIVWEPWGEMGEYLIRAHGTFSMTLNSTTWGSVKALF